MWSPVLLPGAVLQVERHLRGLINMGDSEFQHRHDVAQTEKLLCGGQVCEGPGSIKIIETGVENTHQAEPAVLRYHSKGRQVSLRAHQQDAIAYVRPERFGHILAASQMLV